GAAGRREGFSMRSSATRKRISEPSREKRGAEIPRSSFSARTFDSPPATATTASRFMLYAPCLAPLLCRYTSLLPSGLHSTRPREADDLMPSYLVICRGVAPARASITNTLEVL